MNNLANIPDGYPIGDKLDAFTARNKTTKSRINRYMDWCGTSWLTPDFRAYRDLLLNEGLAPITIESTLSTLRSAYRYITSDNEFRAYLMAQAPAQDFVSAKAFVDEVIQRIHNAIDPKTTPLPTISVQDRSDSDFVRLTSEQLQTLCAIASSRNDLIGARDNAMIRMMAYTGVREAELVALDVDDLRHTLDGYLALRVRQGKGRKQRLIPYGKFETDVLSHVVEYHSTAGITSGAVFRGIKRNGRSRTTRIGLSSVGFILGEYRLPEIPHLTPHDLRRTYAKMLYNEGVPVEGIKANMGHTSIKTTWHYIGTADVHKRVP